MKKKEQSKEELAKELSKVLAKLEKNSQVENMVKDNKIVFKIKEINYRVRRPTPSEQMEIENFRRKKYLEYVSDDTYLFRKQWIEKYKKKGIDIIEMETKLITLQSEIENLMLRLAQTTNEKNVKKLTEEIDNLRGEQSVINIEKTDLLNCSIEDQLVVAVNSFFAYTILEKEIEKEKWVKAFNSYKEFMECKNSNLLNRAFYSANFIIYGDLLNEPDIT